MASIARTIRILLLFALTPVQKPCVWVFSLLFLNVTTQNTVAYPRYPSSFHLTPHFQLFLSDKSVLIVWH
jgi:hypothetical protein